MNNPTSPAEYYNKIRRTLFSTFHKGESERKKAFEYLEGYKKNLSIQSYIGLKSELNFYTKYIKEFNLVVSADVGDHSDFSGIIGKDLYRIDVTTNLSYKKLKDYEPLQKDFDAKYKIAVVNQSGDLDDLIDINFPFCPSCEEGRLIDMAVLLPENYNRKGESLWSNDQVMMGICNCCGYYEEQSRIVTPFLNDFDTEIKNAFLEQRDHLDYMDEIGDPQIFDPERIVEDHAHFALNYLNTEFDKSIMALLDKSYVVTNPKDGDGYICLKTRWRKALSILDDYILNEYDIDIE